MPEKLDLIIGCNLQSHRSCRLPYAGWVHFHCTKGPKKRRNGALKLKKFTVKLFKKLSSALLCTFKKQSFIKKKLRNILSIEKKRQLGRFSTVSYNNIRNVHKYKQCNDAMIDFYSFHLQSYVKSRSDRSNSILYRW